MVIILLSPCVLHLRLLRVGYCDGVAHPPYGNIPVCEYYVYMVARSALGIYPYANLFGCT